jgi:hypothetical protein
MFFKKIGLLSLLLISWALASGYSTDGCTTTGSISSEEDMESFLRLQAVSIATSPEESDSEDTNSQTRHKGKSLSLGANDLLSPQPKLVHTHSLPIISPDPKSIVTRRIAIIGGGGAGSIIAALLSNLSEEMRFDGLRLEITIFERNRDIINGSTFETSAVLHAGGREYPMDPDTAADCQASGALFECMFPGLYDTSNPIMYFPRSGSALTPETQQKAHKMARQKRKDRGLPTTPKDQSSQSDLPPKKIQKAFGSSFSGGVKSTKDKPMKIAPRNARIKKIINESRNIYVENNACVSKIIKNEDGTFNIIYRKSAGVSAELEDSMPEIEADDKSFDHVIITTWDEAQNILDTSGVTNASADLGFIIEDRVMAFCDISNVPLLQKTPLFTLPGGEMFMPLDGKTALIYRCIEGGSYPESGEAKIFPRNVISHGEKILREFKSSFKDEGSSESLFDKVTLLGAKLHKAVRRAGPLSERRYEPPNVTSEGYIVAIPPKATFIGSLALQTIEQVLRQLPDSFLIQKTMWIEEILKLVPNNEQLFTGKTLPRAFTINPRALTRKEILTEKVNIFDSFTLTDTGGDLLGSYQSELENCEALCRSSSVPYEAPVCEGFVPVVESQRHSFKIKRSISDPYSNHRVIGCRKSPATLFDLATSTSEKLKQRIVKIPLAPVFPLESGQLRLKLPTMDFESATDDSDTERDSGQYS